MAVITGAKKIPFRGSIYGHCGIYALANLFENEGLIHKYPPKNKGYLFEDLHEVTRKEFNLKLATAMGSTFDLGEMLEFVGEPLVCTVAQVIERGQPHAVAVVFNHGRAFVINSERQEVEAFPIGEFKYERIAFFLSPDDNTLCLPESSEELKHIFEFEAE